MNKTKLLLMVAQILPLSIVANNYDFWDWETNMYYSIVSEENKTVELTYCEGQSSYSGDVVVPSLVNHEGTQYEVKGIGEGAFSWQYGLTSVVIPKGVTRIGNGVFIECSSLTSIAIPSGVTSVGDWAFGDCEGLTSIVCRAVVPPVIEDDGAFSGVDKSIPVRMPESSIADYQVAEHWDDFTNFQSMAEEDIAAQIDDISEEPQEVIIYDLQGRRMTNVSNLKGFYIANGKKVLIK